MQLVVTAGCGSWVSQLDYSLFSFIIFIKIITITFIKARLIDKYIVAANNTEFHIISKLIFLRIIISKFMMIRQLFHVKIVCTNRLFGPNRRVATLSKLYITVSGTMIPNLKSIGQFELNILMNKKRLNWTYWNIGIDYRFASLSTNFGTQLLTPKSLKSII